MTVRKVVPFGIAIALGLAVGLLANTWHWSTVTVYAMTAAVILLASIVAPLALTRMGDPRLRRYARQKGGDAKLRGLVAAHAERRPKGEAYSVADFITRVTKTED